MLAADFLLQLPQKVDVKRHLRCTRGKCAEQRGESWTFVVGSAAANVAVAVGDQTERVGPPIVAVGGLDVQMVVDGYGRPIGLVAQTGVDERVATGFDELGRSRADGGRAQQVARGLGATPDI